MFRPLSDAGRELGRDWRGVAAGISGMLHEARHADGLHPHVTCCAAQRPGENPACDQTYDESDLGAYGVQYWLLRSLLSGHLHTGYGCLPADRVRDLRAFLETDINANLRDHFCTGVPPSVTAADTPAPACDDSCAPVPPQPPDNLRLR